MPERTPSSKDTKYSWPSSKGQATALGKNHKRSDALPKATGAAKYSYDINPPKMLLARALGCPHAHCKIKSIDFIAAKKVPGVRAVKAMKKPGEEVQWEGDLIACVAGETEGAVAEGLAAIKVAYDVLEFFVDEQDLAAAKAAGRTEKGGTKVQLKNEPGDDEDEDAFEEKEIARLFKESDVVVEGFYGIQAITHMCLEPHGSTCEWQGDRLIAHLSTQNVSGTGGQFATPLGITADDVTVHCDYVGGGFGSKFAADTWGIMAAEIAKETGRPVKFMLDRDIELKTAGSRPSGFVQARIGADADGLVKVWDSNAWTTGGMVGGGVARETIPYVFTPDNFRTKMTNVATNTGPTRAWRAPTHPQGCALSQTALDDVAAKLELDSYDVFKRNLVSVAKERVQLYADEMEVAERLMDWKAKWHPHGKGPREGSIATGLGMAIHTWGGGPHDSECTLKVHPDGGVEIFLGSQDIGTGTRTVIAMVLAESLGVQVSAVKVNLGSSKYPASGPSGGSTTVGGVSESSRRAGIDARDKLFELVAKKLNVEANQLEARDGRIRVKNDANDSLSWKAACSLLGMKPLETHGKFDRNIKTDLTSSGVGGVQMAEVAVDVETGVVKVKKFVAVHDRGLIVNPALATSQVYGAVIMGIAYALFEERIMDRKTGKFINADLRDYHLPRLGDIGDIVVELYEPESQRKRGVIGLGEPPVISPGAAISNAICNALGVRVPVLPATPKRVLDALEGAKKS